jgi:transposase
MRYELTNDERTAIMPMLPNKPGVRPPCPQRHLLCCAPGRHGETCPDHFGPYTTCYNRLIRWRRAGGWAKIMNALAGAHDAAVQMIDTSIVRVHQHGACITRNRRQSMGPSRGGLTSKSHALVDTNGLPIRLAVTAGKAHDNRLAGKLLSCLESGTMLLADRGYEPLLATRALIQLASCGPIPPRCNRKKPICFSPYLYRARNLVEQITT